MKTYKPPVLFPDFLDYKKKHNILMELRKLTHQKNSSDVSGILLTISYCFMDENGASWIDEMSCFPNIMEKTCLHLMALHSQPRSDDNNPEHYVMIMKNHNDQFNI
jgi:hypothetical protein